MALAGNAVENVVGIQLAAKNKVDYAISVILNSSLQVALGLVPVLVILSFFIGSAHLTLVLPPLLVAALGLTALLSTVITYDGESTWLEGLPRRNTRPPPRQSVARNTDGGISSATTIAPDGTA